MKKFIISEDERNRILEMHVEKTKNHYLNEQITTGTTQVDISECLKPLMEQVKPQSCKGTTIDSAKCYKELEKVGGPFASDGDLGLRQAYYCVSEKLGMNK
jgi:hypothetical protein